MDRGGPPRASRIGLALDDAFCDNDFQHMRPGSGRTQMDRGTGWKNNVDRPVAPPHLTRRRLWFVHAVIAFVVGGHVYDVVRDKENWPFSPYPMFSQVDESRIHKTLRIFGITSDGETPLLSYESLHPFDQCRLATALTRIRDERESASADLREAVRDVWARYEARRQSGAHDGLPLLGARLYAVQWHLDAYARNARQPDERVMLIEVRSPAAHSARGLEP
jgi:hypothetical protein